MVLIPWSRKLLCLLVTLLLAKMRQDLATLILLAVTSGSRTTGVIHCRVQKCCSWFLFQALIVYKNHGSLCCLYGQSLVQKSQVWLLSTQWLLGLEHAIERFCWFKVRGASQGEQVEICYLGHGAAFPDILGWLVVLSISSWDYPVMVTVASLQMECSSVFLTTL